MNHHIGCDKSVYTYSGKGYNRVKICVCGAEDHAPVSKELQEIEDILDKALADMPKKEAVALLEERINRLGYIRPYGTAGSAAHMFRKHKLD